MSSRQVMRKTHCHDMSDKAKLVSVLMEKGGTDIDTQYGCTKDDLARSQWL